MAKKKPKPVSAGSWGAAARKAREARVRGGAPTKRETKAIRKARGQ